MNEQELRAWSLAIAALMLGRIGETDDLNRRTTYEPYLGLAKRLEPYIVLGQAPKTR